MIFSPSVCDQNGKENTIAICGRAIAFWILTTLFQEADELYELQIQEWEPILKWFCKRYDVKLEAARDISVPTISQETRNTLTKHLLSFNFWAVHGRYRIGFLSGNKKIKMDANNNKSNSWLQIQRSGFDSRRYQIFWEVVGLEQGPLSLMSTTKELLGRNISIRNLTIQPYGSAALTMWHLLSTKVGTSFTDKQRLLGWYSSLTD
jgi:hypothetical protein